MTQRVRWLGPGRYIDLDTGEPIDMKTAMGNDEGPSSQELWDKMERIEAQNNLLLEALAVGLAETQMHFRGTTGSKLRQLHHQLLVRMSSLRGEPKPNGEG